MPIQAINTIVGFIDGSTVFETPGILLDLTTYEPLLFGVNPDTVRLTKDMVVEDHVIPGQLDLLFLDKGVLGAAAIKASTQFIESLMFPDRGGVLGAIGAFLPGNLGNPAAQTHISEIGHRVSLTYGLWIIERPYRVRRVETETRPGKDPITLLPLSAVARITLQEDEQENINYTERRWGIPA
jgi:hypothetical protein